MVARGHDWAVRLFDGERLLKKVGGEAECLEELFDEVLLLLVLREELVVVELAQFGVDPEGDEGERAREVVGLIAD